MLKSFKNKQLVEAGCDEAGRGCLAGPVVAAAVILKPDFYHPLLNDSKQMSEKNRDELRIFIEANAIDFAVVSVSPERIDEINILQASIEGMQLALAQLKKDFDFILVDGNKFKPFGNKQHECVIKGDSIYASIAAASVLAKTYRDEIMENLDAEFPAYQWKKNKGYPTKLHRQAIQTNGITPHHRKSYNLLGNKELQLNLFG